MYSLPDWAFYPVAAALGAGMIAGAMSFGEPNERSRAEILAEGVVYEGSALAGVTTGHGLTAEHVTDGATSFLSISAARGPFDGIQSAGAFFALTLEELSALQGHRVSVRVTMRQARNVGAEGARIAFFVPGIGQDAWDRRELGDAFAVHELEVEPPSCVWDYGYVGVWPDWTDGSDTAEVERIEVTALEALEC